ncbi:hypothetical protein EJB05_08532, partial [Eragrostis curvula]
MASHGVFATLLCVGMALAVPGDAGAVQALQPPSDIARAECPKTCGKVEIPYPFGIGPDCAAPGFSLSCKPNEDGNGKPFFENVEFINISLLLGRATVMNYISSYCYDAKLGRMKPNNWEMNLDDSPYVVSNMGNMFTVLGCRTLAYIGGSKNNVSTYMTGCVAMWRPDYNETDPTDGSCSGMGCCQTAIPKGLKYYRVWFNPVLNTSDIYESCRCSYAVLMDSSNFRFSTQDLTTSEFNDTFDGRQPLVLLVYFEHRLRLWSAKPLRLRLYYVPERGGFLWMDRAVTSCHLPLQTVEHTAVKGNLQPRHHVYAIDHYSSPGLILIQRTRALLAERRSR